MELKVHYRVKNEFQKCLNDVFKLSQKTFESYLVSSASSAKDDNSANTNARPKLVFFWTNAEVLKWLRRHCEEYHTLYASLFLENDITARLNAAVNFYKLVIQFHLATINKIIMILRKTYKPMEDHC
ncbi:UNVERIFIED_CONTAM: ave [Trichonephila clavipes]